MDETIYSEVKSLEILNRAFEVIYKAHELINCRCVLVECNDNDKVHKVYTTYGFKYLQDDGEHKQFYKRIK